MCSVIQKDIQDLSSSSVGSVTLCGCGTVSLHVGGISVRMEVNVFAETVAMCQQALNLLPVQSVRRVASTETLH
jgi:hypothetical protein